MSIVVPGQREEGGPPVRGPCLRPAGSLRYHQERAYLVGLSAWLDGVAEAMAPTWFSIVKRYPNVRGPTVPFLLGALRTPPGAPREPETAREELTALLVAFRDETPAGHEITIEPCPRIKQPVVVLDPYQPSIRIESPLGKERAFNVHMGYCPDPSVGLASVANALWELHGRDICAGGFSFRDGAFRAFNAQEFANIEKVIALDR